MRGTVTILAAVPVNAIEEYHDPYPQDGRMVDEARMHGRSYWLKQYAQGSFIANTEGVRNTLSVISEVQYSADYIDISNNLLLLDLLEPKFNISFNRSFLLLVGVRHRLTTFATVVTCFRFHTKPN